MNKNTTKQVADDPNNKEEQEQLNQMCSRLMLGLSDKSVDQGARAADGSLNLRSESEFELTIRSVSVIEPDVD